MVGVEKGSLVSEQTPSDPAASGSDVPGEESAEQLYGDGAIPQDADFTDPDDLDDPVGEAILDDLPDGGGREGELPEGVGGP